MIKLFDFKFFKCNPSCLRQLKNLGVNKKLCIWNKKSNFKW